MHAVLIDVPPDPIAIARALSGRPGLCLLHAAAPAAFVPRRSFVACDPVERSDALVPAVPVGGSGAGALVALPRWIGVVPYESGRSLERPGWTRSPDRRAPPHLETPVWLRFPAVVAVDAERGTVLVAGDDAVAVRAIGRDVRGGVGRPSRPRRAACAALPDDDPPRAHVDRIRAVKDLIAAGDLYQANLARRLRVRVRGPAQSVYERLARASPPPLGACLDLGDVALLSTSPELFLDVDAPSGVVTTAPIKGTRPRGIDAPSDTRLRDELDADPKERAELAMIVDVERNDLGRVARPGSVRAVGDPIVETYGPVHHRMAVVRGLLADGVGPTGVLRATFPSGSVTGAPKVRAMEVIAALEPARRGAYTGAYGYVAHDGSLRLAMGIRMLTVADGEGHYLVGGGIVEDSVPERELDETRWKAAQLFALLGC